MIQYNTITEMKNTLEGINSRITEAKERISDLEDGMVEFTAVEPNKEKRMKGNEDSLRDLWDNIKHNNIRIIGVLEGEEREKGPMKIFEEIIVENFTNMGKEIATQVQETQRIPGRINPRRELSTYLKPSVLQHHFFMRVISSFNREMIWWESFKADLGNCANA